ncbi:MAG: hypothetical protein K9L30_13160 [Desulfobacterales bacterium]|nr:hypothetical protein [Desulfobacterales bacterium]
MTENNSKFDVFFYEAFAEEEKALRHYLKSDIKAGFTWKTIQEYNVSTSPAPVISIRTQSVIPESWSTRLSAILSRSTGYDHIRDYIQKTGANIKTGHLPKYCSRAVAEQAMLLWMNLLRKIPQQTRNFSTFHRDNLTGYETENKTLLIVGVGNIGFEISKIANSLGMNVFGVDIDQKHRSIKYVSLEYGLKNSDIIVCAMNLTSENSGYFRYDVLKNAKKGSIFINISRGEFSPAADILRLVDEAHLSGVALDVYNNEKELAISLREKKPSSNEEVLATLKLSEYLNVILTPHNAFNTLEAVERKAAQSIEQIENLFAHDFFLWPVP